MSAIFARPLAAAIRLSTIPHNTLRQHRLLHTHLHRRIHTHSQSFRHLHLHPATATAQHARSISYSYIPRLVIRASTRLPVLLAGGSVAGGAYVINKVENARTAMNEKIDGITGTLGDVFGQVGGFLGEAGNRVGEGAVEARQFGSGMWSSITGFVNGIFEGDGLAGEGKDGSDGNGNSSSVPPPPTPERIAAAAALASTLPLFVGSEEKEGSDTDNELMLLTKKLIEIRSILLSIDHSEGLQLPAIVVVGSQSSGKSSVLEAIVGREFLPKGNNMVTRRPIELTLIHTPATSKNPHPPTFAEFPGFAPGQHITDFKMVQKTLLDLNLSIPATQAVSATPVELRIHSPNVPDLSLVDLPGYIELSSMDQPDSLKEEIANLCEKYIKAPNIVLAVCAADVDLANSPALRASRRVDPLGMRTIGVVTKMDLVEPEQGRDILTNKRYPLALGYVGVVCKAVAASAGKSRGLLTNRHSTDGSDDEGLQVPVRKQEQAYFGANKEVFSQEGIQVTTDLLKRRLMQVLEESMANSLHTISNNVGLELEEARYQFKVQYNDRTVSPESYLAETMDLLKTRLAQFSKSYGKNEVRKMLKSALDDRTMDILAQMYWQDSSEQGSMTGLQKLAEEESRKAASGGGFFSARPTTPEPVVAGGKSSEPTAIWQHKLDAATSALTKSGVGRTSTQLVVDALRAQISSTLTSEEPLSHHTNTSNLINNLSDAILRDRYTLTAEQVENCIKPYKYEVELDADGKDWEKGRLASLALLAREVEMCENALKSINESVGGGRRLRGAVGYVQELKEREQKRKNALLSAAKGEGEQALVNEDMNDPSRTVYNPTLLAKAREALFLQGRTALLKARMQALKSKQCKSYSDANSESVRTFCPEAFLNVVADKLASTAVMFINIELLAEYFYMFPREIETRLGYDLTRSEILEFARENPRFKQHIDLQEKKEKLELVTEKLDALLKLQQERQGPIRHASGNANGGRLGSTGRRFGLF